MLRTAAVLALLLSATPVFAATDRDTAVSQLASLYYSVDACGLILSRAKVEAFADSAHKLDDTLFNVDVFRATQALYAEQKDWTKEQIKGFCAETIATARSLGILS